MAGQPAARTTSPSAPSSPALSSAPAAGRTLTLGARDALSTCERRLAAAPGALPTVAIVGASYTAGVGPGHPALSWAAVLARTLRWNAVIYGVPGVGYVRAGAGHLGPIRRMLAAERLRGLAPALVIVQAGLDDLGVSPRIEQSQAERTINLIRSQAPHARIALLTVFSGPSEQAGPALHRTDRAIVVAGKTADPGAIIMDPLTGRWRFQHADHNHGLHPTAAGDAWIARKVAAILSAHGIVAHPRTSVTPTVCDFGVDVGGHHTVGRTRSIARAA